jgi:hypothetical protein
VIIKAPLLSGGLLSEECSALTILEFAGTKTSIFMDGLGNIYHHISLKTIKELKINIK